MTKNLRIFFTLILFFSVACKKSTQEGEQPYEEPITKHTWEVRYFSENQKDISGSFSGYVFKFNKDSTVIGTIGAQSTSGIWTRDSETRWMTLAFPSVGDPLQKLNGYWLVRSHSYNLIHIEKAVGGTQYLLQFTKVGY
jgi:hypothetical protein